MIGNRPSSLPIARYCAKSPAISEGFASRAAIMGRAFHALAAKSKDAAALLAQLTDDEREEVESWHVPTLVPGTSFSYEDAEVEHRVGLTEDGRSCDPDSPEAMTAGTCDMHWFNEHTSTLYVADIKRTEWTSEPGSLQLHAYALALADKYDADEYCTGIWSAEDGTWTWGDMIQLASEKAADIMRQVRAAAMNIEGDYVVGGHCRGCFGRERCPAWLLPPEMAETSLAPFVGATDLDSERALTILIACQRAADTVERLIGKGGLLREWAAKRGGVVDPASGKKWAPVICGGRKSFDKKALEADHPGITERYTKTGAPYEQWKWIKA